MAEMFKVVVYIEAATLKSAVEQIGNMLNGCYLPGEVVYPVEGYTSDQIDDGLEEPNVVYAR